MSIEENRGIARRYMENVMAGGDLRRAFELCAPSFTHAFPGIPRPIDRAQTEELTRGFQQGFPDLTVTIEEQVVEGAKVATRMTFRGTHRGPFQGIPATGRSVQFTGINVARIDGGKIVALWSEFDALGLLQQIGAVPAPSRHS